MKPSRTLMLTFALTTGLASTGCPRRATLVPPDPIPIPQHPAGAPPNRFRRVPPSIRKTVPRSTANPWKPNVRERKWQSIVIHHTATSRGSVQSIHSTHLKRKDRAGRPWRGIGYHFVIGNGNGMRDGEIEPTFRWRTQIHGAHAGNKQHNELGIGIALIGNFEKTKPTAAQLRSVKRLVAVLKRSYHVRSRNVVGHNSISATVCPGKFFPLAEVAEAGSDLQLSQHRADSRNSRTPLVFLQD